MRLFVGAPGTRVPALLQSGGMRYHCFVLRKPPEAAGVLDESPMIAPAGDAAGRTAAAAVASGAGYRTWNPCL
jgi:hypothetical protein